jgi:hypothetical protein
MGKVIFNMTVSLDGFVAGPNDGPENGLGDGGDALFTWYFSGDTEIPISEGLTAECQNPQRGNGKLRGRRMGTENL